MTKGKLLYCPAGISPSNDDVNAGIPDARPDDGPAPPTRLPIKAFIIPRMTAVPPLRGSAMKM